jgi:hypothetical protein
MLGVYMSVSLCLDSISDNSIILLLVLFVLVEHRASTTYKAVVEVSVAFKSFIETGLLSLCSNPQPGGPGLHIYIPWRLGGPVLPPGTEYPF